MTAEELREKMGALTTASNAKIAAGTADEVTRLAILQATLYECTAEIVDRMAEIGDRMDRLGDLLVASSLAP